MTDHMDYIENIARNDVAVLRHKEKTYGGSWKKRGGVGAFMMLARKMDRIENIATSAGYDIFEVIRREGLGGADGELLAEILEKSVKQVAAPFRMGLFAAAEHDRDLDLVPVLEETLDVTLLRVVVVVGDLRTQVDLAYVDLGLVLAGSLLLLLLLVLVLRVIEQPADRRLRICRDLDQIEFRLAGHLPRLVGIDDSHLLAVGADQPHLGHADALVDTSRVPIGGTPVKPARNWH